MNSHEEHIKHLLDELKKKDKSAKSFSIWIKNRGIKGFSQASITKAQKKGASEKKQLILINYLKEYISLAHTLNDNTYSNNSLSINEKIKQSFLNQFFYVYYCPANIDDTFKVFRMVLRIGTDSNMVILENIKSKSRTDFKGYFEVLSTNRHLYFSLKTKKFQEKLFDILVVRFIDDDISNFMKGTYRVIHQDNSIEVGKLLFEYIKDKEIDPQPRIISKKSKEYIHIPKYIEDYLQKECFNSFNIISSK